MGVAAHGPGLVEGVVGAELGAAVDAEVEGDVGVDAGAGDDPFVLGVGDGGDEFTAGAPPVFARDFEAGVEEEGHLDVLPFVVEVAKVGEVAGVCNGDGVAGLLEGGDELLGGFGLLAVDFCDEVCGGATVGGEAVQGQAVEDLGEADAFAVKRGELGVGAVAGGYVVSKGFLVELKGGFGGGFVEGDAGGLVECVGAEGDFEGVSIEVSSLLLFEERLSGVDGFGDALDGPAGEAVKALPVFAEDELAEEVEELGREGGAGGRVLVDLGEERFGEARLGGELAHHAGEHDGVGWEGGDVLRDAARLAGAGGTGGEEDERCEAQEVEGVPHLRK